MIESFSVKNFLSFREEQTLSFVPTSDDEAKEQYCIEVKENIFLLKIAMIYGINASGKTNMFMALEFLRDLMSNVPKDKTEKIEFFPFLLDSSSRKEHSEMKLIFYLNQERYVLQIIFDQERIYKEQLECYITNRPARLYLRQYNEETKASSIVFGDKLGLSKKSQAVIEGNTIQNASVLAAFGQSNVEETRLNVVYEFFTRKINDLLRPRNSLLGYTKRLLDKDEDKSLQRFLVQFLKASDFNISNVDLHEEETEIPEELEKMIQSSSMPEEAKKRMIAEQKIKKELLFQHQTDTGVFPLTEGVESRGTLRLMGLATLLKGLLMNDRVMMIDEIETSLHYELLSYFIKVFLVNSDKTSQLIMTTHDINLLDEDFIRRDAVWFADKGASGETQLVRLSSLGLHKNVSVYNAYRQNKLVKLPFLGNIYLDMEEACEGEQ